MYIYVYMYIYIDISGSSNQSCESPLALVTLSPFTNISYFVTPLLMVFIEIKVLCPFTPRFFISLSKMKVT